LCGAFESYIKFKQVTRDANLKQTFLQKLVNDVVKRGGAMHILGDAFEEALVVRDGS
jgi:hypothetical protein